MFSVKKHFMQFNHSLLCRHFKIWLHYTLQQWFKDNNSVSKQHSDILNLSQAIPRLVRSLCQETSVLSKCQFTSEKVDSPTPGNLVLVQGALKAQNDLSTFLPLHSEETNIQYQAESSHAWTCTWIPSFPDYCIYYRFCTLCLRKF